MSEGAGKEGGCSGSREAWSGQHTPLLWRPTTAACPAAWCLSRAGFANLEVSHVGVFPCACWPPACLPWKTSVQAFCPLFNQVVWFSDSDLDAVDVVWVLTHAAGCILCKYLLPFRGLSFPSVSGFLCRVSFPSAQLVGAFKSQPSF